jgi:four helix bundle protein
MQKAFMQKFLKIFRIKEFKMSDLKDFKDLIISNISEGYGRRAAGDYKRFLNIAQGSVNETETHLLLSARVGLCTPQDIEMIINELKEETRMISALIKKLN